MELWDLYDKNGNRTGEVGNGGTAIIGISLPGGIIW